MLTLLLITLVIMSLIAIIVNKGDPISPWFIICTMFSISTLVALLNQKKWGVEVSALTVFVIITALLSFGITSILTSLIMDNRYKAGKDYIKKSTTDNPISLKTYILVIFSLFMVIVFYFYFKKTYEISLQGGNPGELALMLKYARTAYLFQGASIGTKLAIAYFCAKGIAYSLTYIILYNTINFNIRQNTILYFIPVLFYLSMAALETGRTQFINFIATFVICGVLLWYKKNGSFNPNLKSLIKIIKIGSMALVTYFIVFQGLGILTGKTQESSAADMLSIYTGSSIPALNIFIENYRNNFHFFGSETLNGLYSTIYRFGVNVPHQSINLEFVYFQNGYNTNVYTSLRSYIYDYGYLGMYIIMLFLGWLYSFFYSLIKRNKLNMNGLLLIYYGYFIFYIVMQSIEDLFMRSMLSVTQIFDLMFIFMFYNLLIKSDVFKKG